MNDSHEVFQTLNATSIFIVFQGNTGLPGERGETGPRVNITFKIIFFKIKYTWIIFKKLQYIYKNWYFKIKFNGTFVKLGFYLIFILFKYKLNFYILILYQRL